MKSETWNETVPPPAGGMARLQARLDRVERADRREKLALKGIFGFLSIVLILFVVLPSSPSWLKSPSSQVIGAGLTVNGQALEMPGMPRGIHYYWVFRKD